MIHRSNPLPAGCSLLSSLAASLAVSLSVKVRGRPNAEAQAGFANLGR